MKNLNTFKSSLIILSLIVVMSISALYFCSCTKDNSNVNQAEYSISYVAEAGGNIEGETNQVVSEGEAGTSVTAVPNTGYQFVKWSDGIANATRTELNVKSDITVIAVFKKITYSIIYETDGNGTIKGEPNQSVEYGESAISVTAIPAEGYKFVKWSDGIIMPERQDKNIITDKTVTAHFDKIIYKLSYTAGEGGYLLGNANQTVSYGESGTKVTAIPKEGYKFVKWSDGETNDTRHEVAVKSELFFTAEFEFLFAGGDGTRFNPYKIESYTQLLNMRYYPDKSYILSCDLDLSGINHEPIFDANECFSGEFYGCNKTIKNLTVQTDSNFPSLFGMIFDGIVSDLNLENVSITTIDFNTMENGLKYYVGTIAGYAVGLIDNVNVSGNITVNGLSYDGVAIGGLVGIAIGTISDCKIDVQIDVKNVFREHNTGMNLPFVFGGMLGVGDSVKIRNCHAQGEIIVNECYWIENETYNRPTEIYIGGLIGYCFTDLNCDAEIIDSVTNITIDGDNHYNAGGFIGYLEVNKDTSLIISNCSVLGDITIGVVGGFVCNGYAYGKLIIENCYTDCEITGYSQAAGFLKTYRGLDNNCIIRNCYSLSNIKTHNVFDSEIIVGYGSGFGYQLSNMEIINCYAFGNINSYRGGGFAWSLSRCKIECCYSNCNITVILSAYGIFVYSLSYTEVANCYSKDIINFGSEIDPNTVVIIKRLVDSQINNFYYSGNAVGAFIDIVSNSIVTNCHILRNSEQATDLIGSIVGDSSIDISDYKVPEEMYFLADKLNGEQEEVWVNQDNDFPVLNFKN